MQTFRDMTAYIDIHVAESRIADSLLLLILLLILLAVVISIVVYLKRRQVWERFASKHGLRIHRELGEARVSGILHGRPFELSTGDVSSDAGEFGVEVVLVSAAIHGKLPEGFVAESNRPETESEEAAQPSVVLEDASGYRMEIHGHREEEVEAYLNASRKETLLALARLGEGGSSGVAEGRVYVQKREILSTLETLEHEVQELLSVAEALDTAGR